MQSKAILRGARVSAQKARLVANLVRGSGVGEAVEILSFTNRKSAPIFRKLIESAVANAEVAAERGNESLDVDDLVVATVTVDEGPSLRRWRPRAQGRATPIEKKTSHITVILESR
jgi:large subunit ribosomal protein L22